MQRISIESTEVHTKSGTSQRTGKPYSIREQSAWLHTGKKYPVAIRVPLADDQQPYSPGDYEISSPLSVGKFESLQVSRDLGLVAVSQSKPRAVNA